MSLKRILMGSAGFVTLAAASFSALSVGALAENATAADSSGGAFQMETVTVSGNTNKAAITPVDTTALGLDMALVDTPRSVTTVSNSLIDQYSLKTVRDLIAITPGTFTASFYGVDGTPNIRGEYADNYFRGFKRVENQGNYQTPMEADLSLEIVRGLPSPAYGAGRAGGYVNVSPHSDRAEMFRDGKLASAGQVDGSAGSYTASSLSGEYGTSFAIGGQSAGVDLYVEHNRAAEYFYGIAPEHTIAQIGYAQYLPDEWKLSLGGQYYTARDMQGTTGLNRVTQDLIDNGNYTSGSFKKQIVSSGGAYITPADIVAAGGVTKYYATSSDYSSLDPSTIKTVKLDDRTVLSSSYDFGNVETFTPYFDLSRELGRGTLKIQGFFDVMKVDSYNAYGFAKRLRDTAMEGRVSYNSKAEVSDWLTAEYVVGGGFRSYDAHESYVYARGYMLLDRTDLSVGYTADSIINPIYVSGGAWDQVYHSHVNDTSAFANGVVNLFNDLHIVVGARYDYYDAHAINTGLVDYSVSLNKTFSRSKGALSYSASASYSTPIGLTPYFTYGRSYALETMQGGAVSPGNVSAGTFLSPSYLMEWGIKGSYFDEHLYMALNQYIQKRRQSELLSGNFTGAVSRGVEAEVRWAIDQHFALSFVATHQTTNIHGCNYLVVTPSQLGISNVNGWGYTYEASTCSFAGYSKGYRDKTQPDLVLGLFANYEVGNGLGFTLGTNYVSSTSGQLPGAVHYPSYFLSRGSAHYDFENYRLSFYVNNIFDKRYYIAQRSTETEGSVMPGEGRTASAKLSLRF